MKIVYKVVVPLLVVATLLLLVFTPVLHVKVEGSLLNMVDMSIPEYNSVYGTIEEINQMDASRKETLKNLWESLFSGEETEASKKLKEEFKAPITWLIVTGVLLGLALLLLLAVLVISLATKKYGLTFLLSALSLLFAFGADKAFSQCAKVLQRMNLSSLLGSLAGGLGDLVSGLGDALGGLLSGLVNNAFKLDMLAFAYGYHFVLLALLALTVFTGGWFIKRRYA